MDELSEISTRLREAEELIGRMDERLIAIHESHSDFKKGQKALENSVNSVETSVNKIWIRISVAFFLAQAILAVTIKYWK